MRTVKRFISRTDLVRLSWLQQHYVIDRDKGQQGGARDCDPPAITDTLLPAASSPPLGKPMKLFMSPKREQGRRVPHFDLCLTPMLNYAKLSSASHRCHRDVHDESEHVIDFGSSTVY